jgi:hypothetical protein
MALFFAVTVLTRYISLRKADAQEEGITMRRNKTPGQRMLGTSILETTWAIEASCVAGALSA